MSIELHADTHLEDILGPIGLLGQVLFCIGAHHHSEDGARTTSARYQTKKPEIQPRLIGARMIEKERWSALLVRCVESDAIIKIRKKTCGNPRAIFRLNHKRINERNLEEDGTQTYVQND